MEHQEPESTVQNETQTPEIDQMKLQMFMQQVKENQNLGMALLMGCGAAIVGAVVWALVTAVSGWQIGFMAIGVGFLVGYAVRISGKGMDMSFGIVGAALSLFGCALGNLLTICISIAEQESMGFFEILGQVDFTIASELMVETFNPMDVLFYGIAIYYGYKYSIYQISDEEIASLIRT